MFRTAVTLPASDVAQPAPVSLESRALRGSLWALAGHAGGQLLRLGGNLVLWRLLYAEAFGLMAIVNVFMQGLAMFSDVGIGPSIIQNHRGDEPAYLNTAWTIQAVRGALLFTVAMVAALPVARFYGQPELATLIPVVAFGAILSGFNSTKLFTATRQIALARLTIIDLAAQGAGLVVMVAIAVTTRSIWALVAGGLVYNFGRLAMGHLLLPGTHNRLCWDKASAVTLLRFGRWIFLSTLLTFAVMQSDRLIFGKLVSMSMLGVYSIATIWSTLPSQILGQVFQSVLFPMLSRVHNDEGDVGAAYRQARAPWLIAAGWLTACLITGGPLLVRFLYDDRAAPAGPILQTLSAGAWFLALEMSNGSALLALGKPKWVAAASGAKLVGMTALIPLGMWLYGFSGAVAGFAVSEVFRYVVSLWGATRSRLGGFRQDVVLTAAVVASVAVGTGASHFARSLPTAGSAFLSMFRHLDRARADAFFEGLTVLFAVTIVWAGVFQVHRRSARVGVAPLLAKGGDGKLNVRIR
jgi:O-antigen/teichoic acid export membrane protein